MKIIEAMKKIKDLQQKADDLATKAATYCANLNIETPVYGDTQKATVDGWLQAHSDIMQEILRLRVAIQRTNLQTKVTVQLGDNKVEKSIAEWIHRRRDLANLEYQVWDRIGDRNLKEGEVKNSSGDKVQVKIVRFYDPKTRDAKRELYRSEPNLIDSTLEVVNAVTDLVE